MKGLKYVGIMLLFAACNSSHNTLYNEIITLENIESTWFKMSEDEQLTQTDKIFFENLYYIKLGRIEFVKWLQTMSPETDIDVFESLVVQSDDFLSLRTRIYDLFFHNKLTYANALTGIASAEELYVAYMPAILKTYQAIDSVCLSINAEEKHSFKYVSATPLDGYCPFLPDNHYLYKQADSLALVRDNAIQKAHPILIKAREIEGSFYRTF